MVKTRLQNDVGLFGDVTFTDTPPDRTDDGETAVPYLRAKERVAEPPGPRWSWAKMYEHLLAQHGPRCHGCDRVFDDPGIYGWTTTRRAPMAGLITLPTGFYCAAPATR